MIDLPDLKDAANIPEGMDDHNDYLLDLEEAAVAHVQRKWGWYVGEPVESTLVVVGDGGGVLWLPEKVSAVTGVVSQPYEGGDQTTIAEGDDDGWALRLPPGETHGSRLVRKGGHGWTWGTEYVVTASIGYDAGMEPPNVRQAVRLLAVHWFENRIPVALGTVAPDIAHTLSALLESGRKARV